MVETQYYGEAPILSRLVTRTSLDIHLLGMHATSCCGTFLFLALSILVKAKVYRKHCCGNYGLEYPYPRTSSVTP